MSFRDAPFNDPSDWARASVDFDYSAVDESIARHEREARGELEPEPEPDEATLSSNGNSDPSETEVDFDEIRVPAQSEAIIKVLAILLASQNTRLELLALVSAFGFQRLLGGRSFAAMAIEAGITKQAFSKRVIRLQKEFHLPLGRGQKCINAREIYRQAQLKVWQRPDRRRAQGNDLSRLLDLVEPRPAHGSRRALAS